MRWLGNSNNLSVEEEVGEVQDGVKKLWIELTRVRRDIKGVLEDLNLLGKEENK